MRKLWIALLSVVAAIVPAVSLVVVGSPAGAADSPLPGGPLVQDHFFPGFVRGNLPPGSDAPGTNNWSCVPTAQHPEPVVLVHGLMGNKGDNWQTYGPLLAAKGYCVYALTYGVYPGEGLPASQAGARTKMELSATEIAAFVQKVLAATHAKKVDIVGHSEGTVVPNYYAKFLGGAQYIDKYVALAPIWHGTNPAGLDTLSVLGSATPLTPLAHGIVNQRCEACTELLASSAFNAKMRTGGTAKVPGIEYTAISTKYDELVVPYTSGIEPGMNNYVVQDFCRTDFAEHFEIAADPVAAQLVFNALDPAHAKNIDCQLVLPLT